MFWHDNWCTDRTMDCLERYLVYGVRKWLDWKSSQCKVCDGKVPHLWKVMVESAKDHF
jgi:hypothetical protein